MILPARKRPARSQTESQKANPAQVKSLQAPIAGLVTNASLAAGTGAIVLENFWPTREGIEPRPGFTEQCNIGANAVVTLFEHKGSGKFFAASSTRFYEFTSATTGALTASGAAFTDGRWVTYEMQNSGGNFLLAVNGVDLLRRFDGTNWLTIDGASTPAITGVATSDLSYVWGHRDRVFFVRKSSLSAYYLATNAIAGAATELPLSATFRKGGYLLMGGTWSSDSGSGMDDRCWFMTDRGEVAVYSGSNPADPNNWALEGVYDVGIPLGRWAVDSIAGDVLFATEDGVIPLSAAVRKDPTQLAADSASAAISPDWRTAVINTAGDWRLAKWANGSMLMALPLLSGDNPVSVFAANMETNAWTTFTGWEATDIQALGDGLYFGTSSGEIMRAWNGGTDNGQSFYCRAMLAHDHLTDPASTKSLNVMQTVWAVRGELRYTMGVARDYSKTFGAAPATMSSAPDDALSEWDIATWDVSDWGGLTSDYTVVSGWRAVPAVGFSFAPWVQVLSGSDAKLTAKLQRIDLAYVPGGAVT